MIRVHLFESSRYSEVMRVLVIDTDMAHVGLITSTYDSTVQVASGQCPKL